MNRWWYWYHVGNNCRYKRSLDCNWYFFFFFSCLSVLHLIQIWWDFRGSNLFRVENVIRESIKIIWTRSIESIPFPIPFLMPFLMPFSRSVRFPFNFYLQDMDRFVEATFGFPIEWHGLLIRSILDHSTGLLPQSRDTRSICDRDRVVRNDFCCVCLFVCLLMVVLWITVGVVAADEWLFRLRWKIHLSFSSWTTRSASSAPAAVLSWAMASLAIQPRRLAHVGHWCWANFSKFFIMDSRLSWDSGDSASPTSLSRRLDNVGDPGKDRLFVSRASSNSWLHKRM